MSFFLLHRLGRVAVFILMPVDSAKPDPTCMRTSCPRMAQMSRSVKLFTSTVLQVYQIHKLK